MCSTEQTECQAFSPVVRIGSPPRPLTRKRVFSGGGGGGQHPLAGEGAGEPNSDKGIDTLVL